MTLELDPKGFPHLEKRLLEIVDLDLIFQTLQEDAIII
jgi:hypothetical protein